MGCCSREKLTRAEKSAKRFSEYVVSLITGILASIVSLGLSAAVITKTTNAAMIWQLNLSIITGIMMIVLSIRASNNFRTIQETTSAPKATYFILVLIGILWITSAVATFVDSPVDSTGSTILRKRYDVVIGIENGASNGPVIGCVVMDFVFILGTIETIFQLMRAIHHARKAEEERVSAAGV